MVVVHVLNWFSVKFKMIMMPHICIETTFNGCICTCLLIPLMSLKTLNLSSSFGKVYNKSN